MRSSFELWLGVLTAALSLACDRSSDARAVSTHVAAGPSASVAPAPSGKSGDRLDRSQRWPSQAGGRDQEFTSGIVDFKPPPQEVALLTEVRAARHDTFDRIVFELDGAAPGFHLEYIDKPVRKCGSGDATPIAGDAWLEVRIEPANAHTPSGAPTISHRDQKVDLEVVNELEQTCDFEAVVSWVVGVKAPNRFRVLTLDNPLRLVVDIKH